MDPAQQQQIKDALVAYRAGWSRCLPEQKDYYRQWYKFFFPGNPDMEPPAETAPAGASDDVDMADDSIAAPAPAANANGTSSASPVSPAAGQSRKRTYHQAAGDDDAVAPAGAPAPSKRRKTSPGAALADRARERVTSERVPDGFGNSILVHELDIDVEGEREQK